MSHWYLEGVSHLPFVFLFLECSSVVVTLFPRSYLRVALEKKKGHCCSFREHICPRNTLFVFFSWFFVAARPRTTHAEVSRRTIFSPTRTRTHRQTRDPQRSGDDVALSAIPSSHRDWLGRAAISFLGLVDDRRRHGNDGAVLAAAADLVVAALVGQVAVVVQVDDLGWPLA